MIVFFACTGKKEPRYLPEAGYKNILCSYHYYKNDIETLEAVKASGSVLFVDSGAFSAKNAGAEVCVEEYSDFLVKIKPDISVSLDVIHDAKGSYTNWIKQREYYGLDCMPTFHMGEPLHYFEEYVDKCDYIALGGMVDSQFIVGWLDNIWTYILKNKPALKVHGFGMTTVDLIYRYPWTSFDSSTWKSGKRFGRVPQFNGRKLYPLSMKKFQLKISDILKQEMSKSTDPKEQMAIFNEVMQRLSDIEGAKAYRDMVDYLNRPNRQFDFQHQLKMF